MKREQKIALVDASGKLIADAVGGEVDASVVVDKDGNKIRIRSINIDGYILRQNPDVHYYYPLHELWNTVKGSNSYLANRGTRDRSPHNWVVNNIGYTAKGQRRSVSAFLDVIAGYRELADSTVDAPKYAVVDTVGKYVEVPKEDMGPDDFKDYPLIIKKGGHNKGTWGPFLTLLKYASWLYPELEVKIFESYDKLHDLSDDLASLQTIGSLSNKSRRDRYHSLKEFDLIFRKEIRFDKGKFEAAIRNIPYSTYTDVDPITFEPISLFHNDVYYEAFGIGDDEWLTIDVD
jgi:hypothetical protein